ncbi:MAG: hypothetical protein PHY16_01130 [Methylobacter sp.]|nr:hypothetical protein [Methylobacter sp.]
MIKCFNRIATYMALILVSSLPFSVDVCADDEKKQKQSQFLPTTGDHLSGTHQRLLTEQADENDMKLSKQIRKT